MSLTNEQEVILWGTQAQKCEAERLENGFFCEKCNIYWRNFESQPAACQSLQANKKMFNDQIEALTEPKLEDCKAVFSEGGGTFDSGTLKCVECDLKWDGCEQQPESCKANLANEKTMKILGCEATIKDSGFSNCELCGAQFLYSNGVRPNICVALQKLQKLRDTAKVGRGEPEQPVKSLTPSQEKTMADADMVYSIMQEMADTFRERSTTYGGNYRVVPRMIEVLFPDGVPPRLVMSDQWHLFELILVKLTRFAFSHLTHIDSVHDMSVYGAMIEMILKQKEEGNKK